VNGASDLASVRSESIQGLSVVTAVFKDGSNIYLARQSLAEKLGNGSRLLDLSEDELRMLQAAIVRYGPLHSSESFVPSTYSPAVTVIEDAVVLSS